MENYVTIFTIVGIKSLFEVLIMKLLLRKRNKNFYKIFLHQSMYRLITYKVCVFKNLLFMLIYKNEF